MNNKINEILNEIKKVIIGKDDKIARVLMALLAEGHILIEDVPGGWGKRPWRWLSARHWVCLITERSLLLTSCHPTLSAFLCITKKTVNLNIKKERYPATYFLADEINRTSSKTQSALLEVMEEGQMTVDGISHLLPSPFMVIATQNPAGAAGTQLLPNAQLDRFLVRMEMGYPDFESQIEILRGRQKANPIDGVREVVTTEEILAMQQDVRNTYVDEKILNYITRLAAATREHSMVSLGVSPRGALAVLRMAKARAFVLGRDYVVPQDVCDVFFDVCGHRILLGSKARISDKQEKRYLAGSTGK